MSEISEPLREKEAGKENPDENQTEHETPDDKPKEEESPKNDTPPAQPEGYVSKDEYDRIVKLYGESSNEAIVLRGKLQNYESRRDLTNEPDESELQAAFPDWELMEPWQKEAARRSFNAERIARDLAARDKAREDEQRWKTDLELTIAQNPSLQGKEHAFKEFANKPTHRGAPMDVLIDAFLKRNADTTPAPKSPTPVATLEDGNGGPRGPVSTKKYTAEEMAAIQASDPRKYRELLLAGAFDE